MQCVWFGSENAATSTSATNFNSPTACFSLSWTTPEAARSIPISEDITITKITLYSDTAPGTAASGKQYTFTIRDDSVDTAASVVLLDTATSVTWTGSVNIAAGSFISVSSTPLNTPASLTNQYWIIEYTTTGQQFLMAGGSHGLTSASATNYAGPGGSNGTAVSATATDFEIVIPSGGTITKMTAKLDGAAGAGTSYDISARTNNTTDNVTVNIAGATALSGSTTGSIAVAAGDTLVLKVVPNSTPTTRRVTVSLTIAPTTNGENFFGYGSAAAPSTTATNFEQLTGTGNNGWNSTENVRYSKPPAYDFKKLYVKLATAPGIAASGKSRTVTLTDSGAATALTTTILETATTGNDTTHTITHSGGGNTGTWRSTVANTPAASAGVHIGYVIAVTQAAAVVNSNFFMFM